MELKLIIEIVVLIFVIGFIYIKIYTFIFISLYYKSVKRGDICNDSGIFINSLNSKEFYITKMFIYIYIMISNIFT